MIRNRREAAFRPGRAVRRGQTLVEYALILAFISVVTISVLAALGRSINGTFSRVNSDLASVAVASH